MAVVAFALFVVAEDAVDLILATCTDNVRDRVEIRVSGALIDHVNDFPTLELFESPRLLDGLELAKAGVQGFGRLCWAVFGVGARLVGLVPVVVLLWRVQPWIPIVIIVALIPVVSLNLRVPVRVWAYKEKLAEKSRRRDHLHQVLTEAPYASDVRLYRAAPAWALAWRSLADQVTEPVARLRARSMGLLLGVGLLSGAVMVLPIWWSAVHLAEDGVGTFVLVLSSIVMLRVVVWVLLANGKDLVESAAGVGKWRAFMETTPQRSGGGQMIEQPLTYAPDHHEDAGVVIQVSGLRFTYPSTAKPVFDGLDLSFEAGTSTAIVGSNGAGKTTLTKLLTGLVLPDEGLIRWGGVDLATVSPDELRSRIAGVPQNFSQLPLTIWENLVMGRDGIPAERLVEVLHDVGLGQLAREPSHLDVVLSKEVAGGTSLSGGQWQRLAIARAALAADRAELFIWDEPTSALDPLVEFAIADRLLHLARGRTSIVVSHRLGICTLVDRVIMLDHGQVVEDGPHGELLERNGAYAHWFEVQGRPYRK